MLVTIEEGVARMSFIRHQITWKPEAPKFGADTGMVRPETGTRLPCGLVP